MKKSVLFISFGLLTAMYGTSMYAHVTADQYAWRLDSIIYDSPTQDSSFVVQDYVRYTYGDRSIEVVDAKLYRYYDTTFVFNPSKTLYTLVDNDSYSVEYMRLRSRYFLLNLDSLDLIDYRTYKKELYLQNDYRNVYDDDGHLLRTIRNYDYIRFSPETDTLGNCTWWEDIRYVCQADDTSSLEQTYYYNYDADSAWVPKLSKSVYSRYTDHRLTYKEDKNTTTLHPNGKPAKHQLSYTLYNRFGLQTQTSTLDESWNEAGDTLSYELVTKDFKGGVQQSTTTTTRAYTYDSTGILTGKTYKILIQPLYAEFEGKYQYASDTIHEALFTYTYDSLGALVSLTRYENDRYPSRSYNYRTYNAHWDGAQWVTDSDYRWNLRNTFDGGKVCDLLYEHHYGANSESHHIIEYDELYRVTLDYDTTYNTATQVGSCKRKEYKNGELILERNKKAGTEWGGWITSYEKVRYDKYTERIAINDGNIKDGLPDTLRWTDRNYHNGFDKLEMCEHLNRQTRQWDLKWCNLWRTAFDDNGAPLSAIKYSSKDGGETWTSSESYVFTYDATKQCYVRTFVAYVGVKSDGTPYSYGYNGLVQEFFLKDGTYVGHLTKYDTGGTGGWYDRYEYDELGRKAHSYGYTYIDSTKTWTLDGREDYVYYPEPDCRANAVSIHNKLDSIGNWYVYAIYGTGTAARTFDIYDDHGAFLEKHNYTWRDSALVCDTAIYMRTTYNELGQLTDFTIHGYGSGAKHNNPVQKVHYFYYPDGTRYLCKSVRTYQANGEWANKASLNNNGLGYIRTDELGRTLEKIYYSTDSAGLVLTGKERHLFYYADSESDWQSDERYTWDTENDEWLCAGVTTRGSSTNSYQLDEQGDLIHREQFTTSRTCEGEATDLQTWHMTYGASLADYPVLQPSAYGIPDEANMFDILGGHTSTSRLLTAHHTRSNDRWNQNYMAHFYYTPLRDEVDVPVSPLKQDLEVEPADTTADFVWPQVSGAAGYTLIVWLDTDRTRKFCSLELDAEGILLSINFSRKPARWLNERVFDQLITGLTPATTYWYTLHAYDEVGLLIDSALGSFTTTGVEDGLTPIATDDLDTSGTLKFVRGGQLLILRDGATYNAEGKRIQ